MTMNSLDSFFTQLLQEKKEKQIVDGQLASTSTTSNSMELTFVLVVDNAVVHTNPSTDADTNSDDRENKHFPRRLCRWRSDSSLDINCINNRPIFLPSPSTTISEQQEENTPQRPHSMDTFLSIPKRRESLEDQNIFGTNNNNNASWDDWLLTMNEEMALSPTKSKDNTRPAQKEATNAAVVGGSRLQNALMGLNRIQ